MQNTKISTQELTQSLPIPLTLLATNSAGRFTIPQGTRCKVERYKNFPNKIVVYVPLADYKRVHPYGKSVSFFVGRKDPNGIVLDNEQTDWREGSPTFSKRIPNPDYLTLQPLIQAS